MPLAAERDSFSDDSVLNIAAASGNNYHPAILKRLPLSFQPQARFSAARKLLYSQAGNDSARFERPEGSFEARAFGNVVHAFLEVLAKRLATGAGTEMLRDEVAGWAPRIEAVLRGDGLAPAVVDRLAARVMSALNNVLKDADGLWILGPRDEATSEFALTSWGDQRRSMRVDRMFFAGEKPLDPGNDYLWIIDYKTSTHGRDNLQQFLDEEKARYAAQLEAYAQIMRDRARAGELRVGLYYPVLARLMWWEPVMSTAVTTD
jgi:hypothetical protein